MMGKPDETKHLVVDNEQAIILQVIWIPHNLIHPSFHMEWISVLEKQYAMATEQNKLREKAF